MKYDIHLFNALESTNITNLTRKADHNLSFEGVYVYAEWKINVFMKSIFFFGS